MVGRDPELAHEHRVGRVGRDADVVPEASRIRELNSRFMEQTVLDLRHRLYSELLRLSMPRGDKVAERVITPPPFHHIVAARIG